MNKILKNVSEEKKKYEYSSIMDKKLKELEKIVSKNEKALGEVKTSLIDTKTTLCRVNEFLTSVHKTMVSRLEKFNEVTTIIYLS